MRKDNTVNFETYKETRNVELAERRQRMFEWQVEAQIEFLSKGKIDDAYDLLFALLGVREKKENNGSRMKCDRILTEVARRGYENEARELRWRLQKYLKIDKGDNNGR